MANQLESALAITLRTKIPWQASVQISSDGTLTPVVPGSTFSHLDYLSRDRQLSFRDLVTAAAVVEVAVEVSDVWGYVGEKPIMQGATPKDLVNNTSEQSFSGTIGSVRHVGQTSIPWDAARYADKDLYGRDAIVYQTLAAACEAVFVDPPITNIDFAGTIPQTTFWDQAEGQNFQRDANSALPLDRDLFKLPDRNLADRDNQLAAYVSRLAQVLKNPFAYATRLYVEVTGTDPREPEVYVLIKVYWESGTQYVAGDEVFYQGIWYVALTSTTSIPAGSGDWAEEPSGPVERIWVGQPGLSNRNRIIYNRTTGELQWFRENLSSVHVPQLYAFTIPGIEADQFITTLPEVPLSKDAQYWRTKAAHLVPDGPSYTDFEVFARTDNDSVEGGYSQIDSASLTVPSALTFPFSGSLDAGDYRVSALVEPDPTVEIIGAQNISGMSGTLGGVTFEIEVSSITANRRYLVEGGSGILYAGGTIAPGVTFYGQSGTTSFTSIDGATVREFEVNFSLALPPGAWSLALDYTNLDGTTSGFGVSAHYVRAGNEPVEVISTATPLPFTGNNGDLVVSTPATFDVLDSNAFTLPIRWETGVGQFHVRQLTFQNDDQVTGRYSMAGTIGADSSTLDVTGQRYMPEVMTFDFSSGSIGAPSFRMEWIETAELPLKVSQVQVQSVGTLTPTPGASGFQNWRQATLDRAQAAIQTTYQLSVQEYGTAMPTFLQTGSVWNETATEAWMSFVEVKHPRVRELPEVNRDGGIVPGHQYEVTAAPVVYNSGTYTDGEKFYGVDSVTSFSSGSVSQVGAFKKARPGHMGRPMLVPDGIFFDQAYGTIGMDLGPQRNVPYIVSAQPWMIAAGFYVANEDFWSPATF